MNKILFIDKMAVAHATAINRDETSFSDKRVYYTIGNALVVCRNGLTLSELRGQTVDAAIALDICQPGFGPESLIGKTRRKVTIFRRILDKNAQETLSHALILPPRS